MGTSPPMPDLRRGNVSHLTLRHRRGRLEEMCVPAAEIEGSARIVRVLLAFPELGIRVSWLRERAKSVPLSALAIEFEEIAGRARLSDPAAREAQLALSLTLIQERHGPWLASLREEASRSALSNLLRLIREESDEPTEATSQERVPLYRSSRELTVGERRSLARRPTRADLALLLFDPHPLVLEQLFLYPHLREEDVLRIATRRPAHLIALETLSRSLRWMVRRRVRLALALNPGCPPSLSLPLLATLPREDLELILSSPTASARLHEAVEALISRS